MIKIRNLRKEKAPDRVGWHVVPQTFAALFSKQLKEKCEPCMNYFTFVNNVCFRHDNLCPLSPNQRLQ
jgi:hypothetical protein